MLVDKRIIFGHSKPESLQDMLVHTNIFGEKRYVNKPPPCHRKGKCKHCPRIDKSGEVTSTSMGRKYRSNVLVSCNSRNLIYMIQCQICKIQYVGQTKNKILQRINQHYSSIRNKLDTPVARHMNFHMFRGNLHVRIYILTLIHEEPDSDEASVERNKWENYWMARLYIYVPKGLNIKD